MKSPSSHFLSISISLFILWIPSLLMAKNLELHPGSHIKYSPQNPAEIETHIKERWQEFKLSGQYKKNEATSNFAWALNSVIADGLYLGHITNSNSEHSLDKACLVRATGGDSDGTMQIEILNIDWHLDPAIKSKIRLFRSPINIGDDKNPLYWMNAELKGVYKDNQLVIETFYGQQNEDQKSKVQNLGRRLFIDLGDVKKISIEEIKIENKKLESLHLVTCTLD